LAPEVGSSTLDLSSTFPDLASNAFLLSFHQHRGENALTRLVSSISWRGGKTEIFSRDYAFDGPKKDHGERFGGC
jgi:hypothetical protein